MVLESGGWDPESRTFVDSLTWVFDIYCCNIYCCFCFCFFSWALHSVKTDIHCTAKCTCKNVSPLDTNRQITLRCKEEVSYSLTVQWNSSTSKNIENCVIVGSWERGKHCISTVQVLRVNSRSFLLLEDEIYKVRTETESLGIYRLFFILRGDIRKLSKTNEDGNSRGWSVSVEVNTNAAMQFFIIL